MPELVSCDRRSMRLTLPGCVTLYASANKDPRHIRPWEGRAACVGCAVGAARAGLAIPAVLAPVGAAWCFRCERVAERVIQGRLCVSCYNREREAIGDTASARVRRKPGIRFLAARLARREFMIIAGGATRAITTPLAVDMRESIALATRKHAAGVIGRPRAVWPDEETTGVVLALAAEAPSQPAVIAKRTFSNETRAKCRAAAALRWTSAKAAA